MTYDFKPDFIKGSPRQFPAQIIKFMRDTFSILEMKSLFLVRGWYWYIIRPLVFPLGVLLWLRIMIPDEPEVNLRVLSGAIVFGVSLSTANLLSQQILQDRFLGRIKLLITMPMSKSAYAAGLMFFSSAQAIPIVGILLGLSAFVNVDLSLTWAFLPMLLAALVGISGIALVIGSYAPSIEIGGIIANLYGIVLVMASPVFFTMDQSPLAIKLIGWVSPMRYAADGITKSISGDSQILVELIILFSFAFISMSIGLWKMRWRET